MKKAFAGAAGIALAAVLLAGPVSAAAEPGAVQKSDEAGKSQQQQPKKAKNLSKRNKAKIEQSKESEKRRAVINKEQATK